MGNELRLVAVAAKKGDELDRGGLLVLGWMLG